MRRAAALAVFPLLAAVAIAGCGSSSSSKPAAAAPSDTYKSVTVSGTFNKAPKVVIPKETGNGPLYTKTVIQGTGAKLTSADGMIANYVAYDWSGKTSKLLGSSYTQGSPSIFVGSLLPGLETALVGQKLGSRVLAVIPPKDAFGTSGNSTEGIGANDTLVFVVDMLSTFSTSSVPGTQTTNGGGALPSSSASSVQYSTGTKALISRSRSTITVAPAARASATVRSRLPPSTTMTWSTQPHGMAASTRPIAPSSSSTGMTTAMRVPRPSSRAHRVTGSSERRTTHTP